MAGRPRGAGRRAVTSRLLAPWLGALLAACQGASSASDGAADAGDPDKGLGPASAVELVDATEEVRLPMDSSPCLVVEDVDGDDRLDVLLDENADDVLDLYVNAGDGTFVRREVPLPVGGFTLACGAGDLDGDGRLDLVAGLFPKTIVVLRNTGAGFSPVPMPSLEEDGTTFGTLSVSDLDGDGWVDILLAFFGQIEGGLVDCATSANDFQCRYDRDQPGPTRSLWLRNAAFTSFEVMEVAPGAEQGRSTNALAVLDWDADGRSDVFFCNDFGANALHLQRAAGAFEDVAMGLGIAGYNHCMGVAFADFNRDGHLDFYIADAGPDQFYFGASDGRFEDRAQALGLSEWTRFHSGWAPVAGDFNMDGRLDLFVVNTALTRSAEDLERLFETRGFEGLPSIGLPQADYLYEGQPGGRFQPKAVPHREGGLAAIIIGATAAADLDGDGDLDIAEVYLAPWTFRLLRNETVTENHWLEVRLRGKTPNTFAVGATVELREDGRAFASSRVEGAKGSLAQTTYTTHFGLGARATIEEILVRWPSGDTTMFPGPVAVDQRLVLEER